MGSKVAAMLVRAGVRQFTLVDDDVLFAANLVRNELSAVAVGAHKVDALRARLIEIAGTIDITVRRVALGGQESADSTDSVMSALRTCDVIIDATADAHCFNFCAAVAKESLKPLIWGEVFAGGIGGLVARVRSGHEPEPQTARNQINAWCDATRHSRAARWLRGALRDGGRRRRRARRGRCRGRHHRGTSGALGDGRSHPPGRKRISGAGLCDRPAQGLDFLRAVRDLAYTTRRLRTVEGRTKFRLGRREPCTAS